jgi:hypothetical protein
VTRDEFITQYAEGSKIGVEMLRQIGLIAVPCDCGDDSCRGWRMEHVLSLTPDEIKDLPEEIARELAVDA